MTFLQLKNNNGMHVYLVIGLAQITRTASLCLAICNDGYSMAPVVEMAKDRTATESPPPVWWYQWPPTYPVSYYLLDM